ncbi:FG-GAP-like repeat-containing protein [Streptomyces sp. NPDC088747]|uniref:FG-GAP-like repeat-containing protein n=1 Tax=Streptomyces sp. NPDC088747 TaxID=3365886 RepID=UPI003806D403
MNDTRPRKTRTVWATGLTAAGLVTGLLAAAPAQSVVGDQVADGKDQFAVKLHIAMGSEKERSCSGTLVDQQWVLTAASCFAANPQQATSLTRGAPPFLAVVAADGIKPSLGAQLKQGVREIVPYPGRDVVMARLGDLTTPIDHLDGPFPEIRSAAVSGATPAQGDELRAIGYGRTHSEWIPERAHTGSFGVDLVNPTTLAISPASSGALCKGDAGGPVLNSSGQVTAVVSASWDGGCFNSDETRTGAVATRVDDIADWVQQVRLSFRQQHITGVMTGGDFNGDGIDDVASLMEPDYGEVFHGRPDGTLQFGASMATVIRGDQKALVAGDFDASQGAEVISGDSTGELILSSRHAWAVGVWKRTLLWTDATWKDGLPAARLRTGTAARDTLVFQWPDGSLYSYKRDAAGNLVNQKNTLSSTKSWKKRLITTADFTGDGRDDIAAVATDGALHLYAGKADGTFDFGTGRSMWSEKRWGTVRSVLGGDFNGDGLADLAALEANGDLVLYAGDGKGVLSAGKSMWPTV